MAGPKGPGRPSRSDSEPDVKQVLLMTALRLGARSGIADVSTRSVAEAAGVTPAMVHYYFGSKQGLFEAVLDEIVAYKRTEIAQAKSQRSIEDLQLQVAEAPPVRDFVSALQQADPIGLIAEVKKASPSAGIIREDFYPVSIARIYEAKGDEDLGETISGDDVRRPWLARSSTLKI